MASTQQIMPVRPRGVTGSTATDRSGPHVARVRRVTADAAFDRHLQVAGIGVAPTGQVLAVHRSIILPASTVAEAEAKAVVQAIAYLSCDGEERCRPKPPGTVILSDNAGVIRAVRGKCDPVSAGISPVTIQLIRGGLGLYGYELRKADRSEVRGAHRAARMALRAYRLGASA